MANKESFWNQLLKSAQEGDTNALNDLCKKIRERLEPILQYRLMGLSIIIESDDILQETLKTFYEKINCIEDNPQHYAHEILRNKIGDAIRYYRKKGELTDPIAEHKSISTKDQFHQKSDILIQMDFFIKMIKRLFPFCQLFFTGILEEKSVKEIWEICKKTEPRLTRSAFDKRIFNCRRQLKKLTRDQK